MAKTVFVGCKLPSGLYLDTASAETTPGLAPDASQRVLLSGTNTVTDRSGLILPDSGGYGITEVDADFFADWLARHQDYPPVKAGLIFAIEREADAKKEAKARSSVSNGTEGADPGKPGPGLEPVAAAKA